MQDQWQRKKQTKEEARKAKRAKLDPDNAKSAKDVMDENARKRKREEEDGSGLDGLGAEKPKEGLKVPATISKKPKKKRENAQLGPEAGKADHIQDTGLRGEQRAKVVKRKEKKVRKNAIEASRKVGQKPSGEQQPASAAKAKETEHYPPDGSAGSADEAGDIDHVDVDEIVEDMGLRSPLTASPSPLSESPACDISTGQSGASSISSIVPPVSTEDLKRPLDETKKARTDPEELKVRLQKRIEDLRAARKADGLNGFPARNRQELMEARRRKEEQRKAHKKELRQMGKREEQKAQEEALVLKVSSASGPNAGPLGKRAAGSEYNYSFGRVAFDNGEQMDAGLSTLLDPRKKKGPQDPLTAIKAAESKQKRIDGLDEVKRADVEEKDVWLNARKRAHGERVRDDTSLLKKTLKRKEKAKQKSEKEWKERLEGVEKGKAMRQKKRQENLRKRRDEKGVKGKKQGGKGAKATKPKPRPGFEGSFRAKAGSRKT